MDIQERRQRNDTFRALDRNWFARILYCIYGHSIEFEMVRTQIQGETTAITIVSSPAHQPLFRIDRMLYLEMLTHELEMANVIECFHGFGVRITDDRP